MKFITTILAAALLATAPMAGEVSMSSAAHLPAEEAAMGGSSAQWVVPLLAIAIIALVLSNDSCDNPRELSKADYLACFPNGF